MGFEVFRHDAPPRAVADYTFSDEYRVPLMERAPEIDGRVDGEEWKLAAGFDGLSYTGAMEERRARAFVGATRTHLYFAIVTELPPDGKLITEVKAHSDKICWDDAIEVWIDPFPGERSGVEYQMLANSAGCDSYQARARGDVKTEDVYGWKGDYRIANGFHDGYWHCEIEVPVAKLVPGRKATDGRWGINLCRDWKNPWAFASLGNRGYDPGAEIVFTFAADGAAAVRMTHETDPTTRNIDAVLSVHNPAAGTAELSGQLFLIRDKLPEISERSDRPVRPGQTGEVRIRVEDAISSRFELFAVVRGADGAFHYTRFYKWGPPREARWHTQKKEVPPLDFRFAYYPYANRMRVRADVSGLAPEAKLQCVDFTIRPKGGGPAIENFRCDASEFADGRCEKALDLPPLSGEYEIVAKAEGKGVPAEPVVKPFQRTVYEWEHQKLGTSRTVHAPFTPIEVEGRTLRMVLKEYEINGCGLLDHVRTDDQQRLGMKEILAGPMRYAAAIDGAEADLRPGSVEIVSQRDDEVIAEGDCSLGEMPMRWRSALDYDGMLRVDLTLSPTGGKRVDRLDLEIPIRGEVAEMMHAMADGLRYPILTAPVPPGEGMVWDAGRLVQTEWPANFCTYLFLGDPARGICWFAENDAGWSWDPAAPNLELIRDGDVLTLRVHLVNRPLTIDAPRTITFGLQAAPVKPRLEGWRHKWFTDRYSIVGTDIHWFALGCCASVYPAGKDLFLWEMLARGSRERLSDAEVEQVVKRGRKYFEPHGENVTDLFVRRARENLRSRLGTTMVFYYNRSSYPAADEFQTFMDEWCPGDYNPFRGSHSRYEVKIVPSESYIDFALHWYGRSFDVAGNTGVYIDNNFFDACYNRQMTGAYVKADGSVMPSTGMWGLRELAKRTFVYLNERGMLPITMVHMTSAQILPLNSFYTVQYDWEWRFSEGDVQDRFSREYLLLATNGEHVGAWPIVLHEQGKCVSDPWTLKTYLAVAIVHELIVDPYVWDVEPIPSGDTAENRLFHTFRGPITEICRSDGVEVYRYWDQRPQPVRASSPDLRTIVYSRKGAEAIVAIASFSDNDEQAELTIDPAALGFAGGYRAIDVETGREATVSGDRLPLALKRHDLKEFRLLPGK